jgi:hypothetical protein
LLFPNGLHQPPFDSDPEAGLGALRHLDRHFFGLKEALARPALKMPDDSALLIKQIAGSLSYRSRFRHDCRNG